MGSFCKDLKESFFPVFRSGSSWKNSRTISTELQKIGIIKLIFLEPTNSFSIFEDILKD
jgi:hypothetical protein